MTNLNPAYRVEHIRAQKLASHGALAFDWVMVILGLWMIGGVHLDAWAHHKFDIETFLTAWHALMYSGYIALTGVLMGTFIRNVSRGAVWRAAVPAGYGLSLLGAAILLIGVFADMLWHARFNIRPRLDALLNPPHLFLVFGSALMISGPLRAAWKRPVGAGRSWVSLLPAILSLALLLAGLSFFTSYSHPLSDALLTIAQRPPSDTQMHGYVGTGMSSILLQSTIMMGIILLAVRRWWLPIGSLTLMITIAYGLTVSIHENFFLIPFEILAGLAAEILYWRLKPTAGRPASFRWFSFGVPLIFYTLYFLALSLTNVIWWTISLRVEAILLSGLTGWLLSYAVLPPPAIDKPEI